MDRDKFTCQKCGDKETELHIHHLKYTESKPQDEPIESLITLCAHCHKITEYTKEEMGFDQFEMFRAKTTPKTNHDIRLQKTKDKTVLFILDESSEITRAITILDQYRGVFLKAMSNE